jgi:hypothetical protein
MDPGIYISSKATVGRLIRMGSDSWGLGNPMVGGDWSLWHEETTIRWDPGPSVWDPRIVSSPGEPSGKREEGEALRQ